MDMLSKNLPYILAGISVGGQYALIAIGYTMVYGILRLINFAHGDIFMVAGLMMVYISASGDGVKVVFEARMEWGNLIDNQFKMAEFLGVPNLAQVLDEKCKDGSRGHFITTEEDLIFIDEDGLYDYYNEEFDKKWTPEYRAGHSQATIDIQAIIGKQ